MHLLGIEATAKNIRGNKSEGGRDLGGYKNYGKWRGGVCDTQ